MVDALLAECIDKNNQAPAAVGGSPLDHFLAYGGGEPTPATSQPVAGANECGDAPPPDKPEDDSPPAKTSPDSWAWEDPRWEPQQLLQMTGPLEGPLEQGSIAQRN